MADKELRPVKINNVRYLVDERNYVYSREADGTLGDDFLGIYDEKTKTIKEVKEPKDAFDFLKEKPKPAKKIERPPPSPVHTLRKFTLFGKKYLWDEKNDYTYHRDKEDKVEDWAGIFDFEARKIFNVPPPKDAFTNVPQDRINAEFLKDIQETAIEKVMTREKQQKGKKKLPTWFKPGGGKAKKDVE